MSASTLRIPVLATMPAVALPIVLSVTLALAGCGGGSADSAQARPAGPASSASDPSATATAITATGTITASAAPTSTGPMDSTGSTGSSGSVGSTGPLPRAEGAKVSGAALAGRISTAITAAQSASFSIVVTGVQPSSATGVTAGTGAKLQLRMKAEISPTSTVEIIKKDGVVYLKPPSPVSAGKAWLKITNAKNDPFRTFYTTLFQSLETSADVGQTAAVIGQMGTFTTGASEVVDGAQTTRYVATPPASVAVKLMPSSFQQLDADTLSSSRTAVSVWLDASGLIRRVSTSLTLPAAQQSQKATSVASYQDWGTPIAVTAPPSSQVASPVAPAG